MSNFFFSLHFSPLFSDDVVKFLSVYPIFRVALHAVWRKARRSAVLVWIDAIAVSAVAVPFLVAIRHIAVQAVVSSH